MTGVETPLFHVGFLVRDIQTAMVNFHELLGVTFNEPQLTVVGTIEDPEPCQRTILTTYSQGSPVTYELIQGVEGPGQWSMSHGEGLHHIGLWSPDATATMSDLATRGYESAARVFDTAGQLVAWYNDATQSHCVRIEFVDERIRQQLELYIQTGRYDIKL